MTIRRTQGNLDPNATFGDGAVTEKQKAKVALGPRLGLRVLDRNILELEKIFFPSSTIF